MGFESFTPKPNVQESAEKARMKVEASQLPEFSKKEGNGESDGIIRDIVGSADAAMSETRVAALESLLNRNNEMAAAFADLDDEQRGELIEIADAHSAALQKMDTVKLKELDKRFGVLLG